MPKFLKDVLVEGTTTASAFVGNGAGLTGVRPFDDVINVRDHGATGDGSTDDTAAIQAALTAAATAKRRVHVPPGTYVVTTVTVPDGVDFRGVGIGSILKRKAASNASMVVLNSLATVAALALDGNKAGQAGTPAGGIAMVQAATGEAGASVRDCVLTNGWGCGITALTHVDFEITRNTIDGIENSSAIYVTEGSHRPRIEANRITNCLLWGIMVRATDNPIEASPLYMESPIVVGNVVDYRGLSLAASPLGIELFGAQNSGTFGISGGIVGGSVSENQVFAPDQAGTQSIFGISIGGASGTTVVGNSLIGGPQRAFLPALENGISSRCVFSSNYVADATLGFSISQNTEHISIVGNTFVNCTNNAISLSANSLGLKVIGNTFRNAGGNAIFLGVSATGTSIVGTMVRSNHFYTSSQGGATFVGLYSTATGGGTIAGTIFEDNVGAPIPGGTGTAGLRMVEINGGGIDSVTGNLWDCAAPAGGGGESRGLIFQAGTVSGVTVRDNTISNASTAAYTDFTTGGLPNHFIANRALGGGGFDVTRTDNVSYGNTPATADHGYPDDFAFAADLAVAGAITGPGGQSIVWSASTIDLIPTAATKLKIIDATVFGGNDAFFQAWPGATGHGVLENWGGIGFVLNGNGTNGLRLAVNRTVVAAFGAAGVTLVDVPTAPTTDPVGGGILYSDAGLPMWRDPTGTVTALAGGGGGAEYSGTVGDGTATDIAVAHGLGTRDVSVTVRQAATPYATALVSWDATDVDTVTLHFTAAPAAGQYRVTVMAGGVAGGGGGSGTVTSVALTVPAGLSVAGSPITAAGTLAITTALAGVLKGTGSGFAAAVAGTDYLAPTGNGSGLTGLVHNPEPAAVVFDDDVSVQGILTAGSGSHPSLAPFPYAKALIYNQVDNYVNALIATKVATGFCGGDFSFAVVNASDVASIYFSFGFDVLDVADVTTRSFWLYDTPGGQYSFAVMNDGVAVGDLGGDRAVIPHLAKLAVVNGAPAKKGLVVRGAASQTASLQEWQNSGGTALTLIKPDGTIVVSAVTAPTAAGGQLYYDSARKALGVGVGTTPTNVPLTGAVSVNTTPVTANAASSTAAQNLMGFAVPAGLLNVAGKTLRLFGAGVLSINTTATATVAVKLGAATLATWTSASITGGAGTANSPWNFDLVTATVAAGATGTAEAHGRFSLKPTTGAGAATVYNDVGSGPSAAVDLTAAQTLQVTVTFSANGAGGNANACTQRLLHVELSN
jgi:hypothetical protein